MPAASASSMAASRSNAPTSATLVVAPVALTADAQSANSGTPLISATSLREEMPPTMLVPYSFIRRLCMRPARPLMPCTITGVWRVMRGLIILYLRPSTDACALPQAHHRDPDKPRCQLYPTLRVQLADHYRRGVPL